MDQEQSNNDHSITDAYRSKNNEDYISKLPDDILEKILTVHPLDSGSKAVAFFTGLLDRPYEQATLKIYNCQNILCFLFANFDVNNPIKTRRKLEYRFNQGMILTATISFDKKQLDLDISIGNQEILPCGTWILFNSMTFARIGRCPCYVNTLKLTCGESLSNDFVSYVTYNIIPFVKCLIIYKCNGLKSLRIERHLGELISLRVIDCVALKKVYVDNLMLKTLHHLGNLCLYSFEYVPRLEDVKLACKGPGFQKVNVELFLPLLNAIRDVKVLTLHGWMFQDVFGPLLFKRWYEHYFQFSKLTDLWWIDNRMEDNNINSLFYFLKFCTSLERLFITIDPQSYTSPNPFVYDNHSSSSNKLQKWQLMNLKAVKLEGFTNKKDMMFIKEHLMKVFYVEPCVVDVRQGMHSRCLIRTTKQKTKGPRNIKTTKSKIYGMPVKSDKLKFSYKFVEETEETIGLCSKHPHMP